MAEQRRFFDLDERYAAPSKAGDPLERLAAVIDFEIFGPDLDAALKRSDGSKGGWPPIDSVRIFKVLVLQVFYGLSDAQAEFRCAALRVKSWAGGPSAGFSGSTTAMRCRTRPPSGGFARRWSGPVPSRRSSRGSTRI